MPEITVVAPSAALPTDRLNLSVETMRETPITSSAHSCCAASFCCHFTCTAED